MAADGELAPLAGAGVIRGQPGVGSGPGGRSGVAGIDPVSTFLLCPQLRDCQNVQKLYKNIQHRQKVGK